jgi:hypothetical protein
MKGLEIVSIFLSLIFREVSSDDRLERRSSLLVAEDTKARVVRKLKM